MPTIANDAPRVQQLYVLHNAREYKNALALARQLLEENPKRGSEGHQQLELVTLLIEVYEARHVPEPPIPTPTAVVEFMLEQKGLTRADLAEPLGGRSRVSEFFAGKRALSTNQIRALRDLLGVPADLLIG